MCAINFLLIDIFLREIKIMSTCIRLVLKSNIQSVNCFTKVKRGIGKMHSFCKASWFTYLIIHILIRYELIFMNINKLSLGILDKGLTKIFLF